MNTHWIALYLAGQYPGKYIIPNKLDIFFKMKMYSPTYFNDWTIALLQGKSDIEYFKTLLDNYKTYVWEKDLAELLKLLDVPESIQQDPFNKTEELYSIQDLNNYLDTLNEADFSRFVVIPILRAMGYKDIEYKWEVNESDLWLDFYVMKFTSPGWVEHLTWIQTKAKKMTNWSSKWSELFKLISETSAAFSAAHISTQGEKWYISEYIVFNSVESPESAIKTYFESKEVQWKNIRYYGKDGILTLAKQLKLEKNFYK